MRLRIKEFEGSVQGFNSECYIAHVIDKGDKFLKLRFKHKFINVIFAGCDRYLYLLNAEIRSGDTYRYD